LLTAQGRTQSLLLAETTVPGPIVVAVALAWMRGWESPLPREAVPAARHIPIIFLTAHALVSDREKAFEAGCDDYDTKPVEFRRLSDKIENLLVVRQSS